MNNPHQRPIYLKQFSHSRGIVPLSYPLSHQPIAIGTDSRCQIVINANQYPDIAAYHAEIRPDSTNPTLWQIRDLGTSSGTYINNQQLQGYRTLQIGDRIRFGQRGLEFTFEVQTSYLKNQIQPINNPLGDSLRRSQLFPLFANPKDLWQKAYLVPGAITVLCVIGLIASIGNTTLFNTFLSLYLILAGYYFIYRVSGKAKPWWLLLGAALMTIIILFSPIFPLFILIFRQILPGNIEAIRQTDIGFIELFIRMFFGAGLLEELLKALPVFVALAIGRGLRSPKREQIGVWEPLDGILIATASAAGFTWLETLGQYVPGIIERVAEEAGQGAGELVGVQLLIPRILGSVAGHMAYSGYFGYFIGLSVLKPSKRWQLLGIGYLTSATLHALWNSISAVSPSPIVDLLLLTCVGLLSFAFLMAAILKARQLSPHRSQNWATQYLNLPPQPRSSFSLYLPNRTLSLAIGTNILARDISGLRPQSNNGIVAQVNANPQDPTILGLQNLSCQIWTAIIPSGSSRAIDPGKSVKLTLGTRINFGSIQGEIR